MKIVAINGSHRGRAGKTAWLLDLVLDGVCKAGAEGEVIDLSRMKINRCLGCFHCQSEKFRHQCVFDGKDDVRSIFDTIRQADIVIYATPVYVFGMSSLLKSLLERVMATSDCDALCASNGGLLFHAVDHTLSSRPFVALICCDNMEDATPRNTIDYFKTYARFMDAPQTRLLVRNGAKFLNDEKALQNAAFAQKLSAIQAAFIQAGFELGSEGKISRSTMRAANQELIPVPLFPLLKKIRSKKMKTIFAEKAKQMLI